MSRILNRPMFRGGGRVNSRGTGITSGLDTPKRGLVDGPGGYAGATPGVPIFLPKTVPGVPMVIPQAGVPSTTTGASLLRGGSSLARYLPEFALPFAPTAGIAALLNPETESEKEAMRALEEGVDISGEAVDPNLYDALSKEVGKTRAAEDRLFSEGSTGVLQRIYDVLNPSKETILQRIQEANKTEGEPIIKTRAYREEKAKLDEAKKIQEELEKQKKKDSISKTDTKTDTGTETIIEPEKSNADVINEYMNMFKSVLGSDQDELTRQRYLELAKFGTNLLAQGGGKRGLMEKIGAAGTQSLEGLSKIAAQERASDRQIKLAAIQAAMKEMDPGTVGKAVRDLKKLVPREKGESSKDYNARITSMALETGTGAASRAATAFNKLKDQADRIEKSDLVDTPAAALNAAKIITTYNIPTPKKETEKLQDKEYYIRKDGIIYKYDAVNKKGILPGEPGF